MGLLTAVAGTALFAWLVWSVGPAEIWTGFGQIGWGLVWILILGGLRFAARAAAWTLCIEPPHTLRFADAFNAVVCGDALGNATPLGPLVGEPAKIACVRGRVPVGVALTALAIENVIYTLSVAAMIAAGGGRAARNQQRGPERRRGRPAAARSRAQRGRDRGHRGAVCRSRVGDVAAAGGDRDALSGTGARVDRVFKNFALSNSRSSLLRHGGAGVMVPLVALELGFHALGVAEKHLTLWLILGVAAATPHLVHRRNDGPADHGRLSSSSRSRSAWAKPGPASSRNCSALAPRPGVTVSIVRKARMGIWSLIGTAPPGPAGLDGPPRPRRCRIERLASCIRFAERWPRARP